MRLTPFVLFILFSLLVSAGLGMLGKGTARQRVRSAVSTFVLFIVVGLAIAWLIYPFSH